MKFYKIDIQFKDIHKEIKYISFPKGKSFKNFNTYFEKDKDINNIVGFNKNDNKIFIQWYDRDCLLRWYNKYNKCICEKWYDGKIEYPKGKEKYDEYIREKQTEYKKKKLEKILK